LPKKYPRKYWWELSYFTKAEAGFRCERCGDPERPDGGHTLTTNQLIEELGILAQANLVVLCRHCQGHVRSMDLRNLANQLEMFTPFELRWLQPHLERLGIQAPTIELITGGSRDKSALNAASGELTLAPRS